MPKYYMNAMLSRLTAEDTAMLKAIYAPQVVAVPPCDACRNLCVTPDGEIRIYGRIDKKEPNDAGTAVYIASRDAGMSWKMHYMPADHALGAAGYNPETGRYIDAHPNEFRREQYRLTEQPGTWAVLNEEGFDSTNHRFVRLTDKAVHILKKPYYFPACRRWIIAGQTANEGLGTHIILFISDDDGETWREQELPHAPKFEVKPPHKGVRWEQCSCEPTIADLGGGRLMMLVRTAQDFHYIHYSDDRGDTWTAPVPSPFHGTITMPVLENLSDGRIVLFWCNTQPMPELELEAIWPPLNKVELAGIAEDYFTNRDANHLAITEDGGKSWIGLRELYLNPIRNNADFRSIGGVDSRDKSIHQAEILELPYNKLLISFGQNTIARKVVILDIDWLYEKERREDFRLGLENVSTQMYLRSNPGNYRGFSGHCAYNRTNGALLIPDPAGNFREVLQICRVEDDRLAYKKQGAVWNFPASAQGRVSVEFMLRGSGIAISLTDHWYNPADETVRKEAFCSVDLTAELAAPDAWHTLTLDYDTDAKSAVLSLDGEAVRTLPAAAYAPHGLSYLHLQTLAEGQDLRGTLVRKLEKTV